MIDFIDILKTRCELIDWIPIVGSKDIQNFTISQKDLTTGKTALLIDLPRTTAFIDGGSWSQHNYTLELLCVRKFEAFTKSSISETTEQKYNARLFELQQALDDFLYGVFQWSGATKVTSLNYNYVMNVLSKSVDGILCTITVQG